MSIQWTIIATFLYAEIGTLILLLLPFISPTRWQKFFKSRVLKSLERQSNIYFNVFIVILILFFIDAIRDVRKYTTEMDDHKSDVHSHVEAEMQIHMKLFRAQRNFYISGFALFLWLVLRRLVTLISAQATLIANSSAAMKQAQNASDIASKLINEKEQREAVEGETADNAGNVAKEEHETEIKDLRAQLKKAQEELTHAKHDLESMKSQSANVTKEYDRLLSEYDNMKKTYEESLGIEHDKKGD